MPALSPCAPTPESQIIIVKIPILLFVTIRMTAACQWVKTFSLYVKHFHSNCGKLFQQLVIIDPGDEIQVDFFLFFLNISCTLQKYLTFTFPYCVFTLSGRFSRDKSGHPKKIFSNLSSTSLNHRREVGFLHSDDSCFIIFIG